MKKIKNRHGKKMKKLIPHLRKIMKDLAKYIPSPMEAMLRPGLSSLFPSDEFLSLIKSLTGHEPPPDVYHHQITHRDKVNIELNKISTKYKKICVFKLYKTIRKQDFYNYCVNNYKFNPMKKIEDPQ